MEEDKKILKELLQSGKNNKRGHKEIRFEVNSNCYYSIIKILCGLEELEKENKELIEAWCRDYKEITGNVTEKYIPKIFAETKFIPKSKIEDKIKELESIIPPDDDYNFELMNMLDNQIQILKELLEE